MSTCCTYIEDAPGSPSSLTLTLYSELLAVWLLTEPGGGRGAVQPLLLQALLLVNTVCRITSGDLRVLSYLNSDCRSLSSTIIPVCLLRNNVLCRHWWGKKSSHEVTACCITVYLFSTCSYKSRICEFVCLSEGIVIELFWKWNATNRLSWKSMKRFKLIENSK